MRLLITSLGTLGDVLPFIPIGREMKRRGHEVHVITSGYFTDLLRAAGLEIAPLGTVEDYLRITGDPRIWNPLTAARRYAELMTGSVIPILLEKLERLHVPGDTMMLAGNGTFVARFFQEKFGTPLATTCLTPQWLRSARCPPIIPGLPHLQRLPYHGRRWVLRLAEYLVVDRPLREPLNRLRAAWGLPPVTGRLTAWWDSPDLIIGFWPAWFAEPAPDWPRQLRLTGFPLYDAAEVEPLSPVLSDFLTAGEPPIIFTPGSPPQHAHQFFRIAVQVCRRLDRRGILVTRHAGQIPDRLPAEVMHVPYVPFSRLLPRAAAFVHHAGIGTLAQALAAGVPQVVVPWYFDQPDNAARLARLGVARVVPPADLRPGTLAAQLRDVMRSEKMYEACRRYARRLAGQEAVAAICDLLESAGPGATSRRR